MILTTCLPIYQVAELEIFKRNIEIANPEEIVIYIDYYFDKNQDMFYLQFVRELGEVDFIKGNWRNRASCLLRLVRYIAESGGDGLIVDSDVPLPQQSLLPPSPRASATQESVLGGSQRRRDILLDNKKSLC
jgi:hypothetical protein